MILMWFWMKDMRTMIMIWSICTDTITAMKQGMDMFMDIITRKRMCCMLMGIIRRKRMCCMLMDIITRKRMCCMLMDIIMTKQSRITTKGAMCMGTEDFRKFCIS